MKFVIKDEETNQRLDKFLAEKLKGETRSQIKKMIKNELVLVNNKPAKVHHFLKAGQTLTILPDIETKAETTITEKSTIKLIPKIIYENENFLILEKPIGMLVHPTDLGENNTLTDWLHKEYPETETVGEYNYRGGIIHRLDKDVSGIMVVAKQDQAFYHLKNQFKKQKEFSLLKKHRTGE